MSFSIFLLSVAASAPMSLSATRDEVAAQRAAIEQRFAREQVDCEHRFAVSPCLDDLRRRRQAALAPLIQREHELDAEDRRARAAAQVQRVKERELAAAQDEGERRQRLVAARPPAAVALPASHPVRALPQDVAERALERAARAAAQEAGVRRERAEERQARMRERQAAHDEKQKARTKPLAAPLPLPGASAASR